MAKVQLSEEEMQLVCNSEWILTKQRIIEKVYVLFGHLSEKMQAYVQLNQQNFPSEVLLLPPKISKGEQYEYLPYVVLDYPRLFTRENVFAIRTFFWWGNYFSITLHLKGIFQHRWHEKVTKAAANKKWKGFHLSSSGNEFSFNLEGKNYRLDDGTGESFIEGKPGTGFLKISYKVPFTQWNAAAQKLMEAFELFAGLQEDN